MNVLMVSGDRNILIEGSGACARLQLQRAQVERLDVFVWPHVHSLRTISQAIESQQYDVITAQDPFWRGLLAWYLARRAGATLNLQVHTDISALPFVRRIFALFLLARADSVRAVSHKIREYLIARHIRAHIAVLPIYIDLAPFKGLTRTSQPHFRKTILWIGRFESEKDPAQALSILVSVRASGIDAGLIMLGTGSLEAELRRRARELDAYVEFPGWQSPLPYLACADVVVSTSRHESYGASIIEALAAGVPVVSPDIGIAKEAGAIVAERSELAQAIINVLHSGERGALQIAIPDAEEWAKEWRATLL